MKDIINGKRFDTFAKDTKSIFRFGNIEMYVTGKGTFFLANEGQIETLANFIFSKSISASSRSVPTGISPIDAIDARRLVEAFAGSVKMAILEEHFESQIEDA